ncbi:MAG: NAD(P)H-dependent oxidoreductase [Bacteroidota bacterium]
MNGRFLRMSNTLIIVGSARRNGNTMQVARHFQQESNADLVDLLDLNISHFRYDQAYPLEDDFLNFIEVKLLSYSQIIFASPVYWYSMSGHMKVFFDRLSDLLKSRKDLGRQLRGKTMSVISCAGDKEVNDSFYSAFQLSADYLGMNYGEEWHGWIDVEGVKVLAR